MRLWEQFSVVNDQQHRLKGAGARAVKADLSGHSIESHGLSENIPDSGPVEPGVANGFGDEADAVVSEGGDHIRLHAESGGEFLFECRQDRIIPAEITERDDGQPLGTGAGPTEEVSTVQARAGEDFESSQRLDQGGPFLGSTPDHNGIGAGSLDQGELFRKTSVAGVEAKTQSERHTEAGHVFLKSRRPQPVVVRG